MTSKCSIAGCFFSSKNRVPASHSKVATSADIAHSDFHSYQLYEHGLVHITGIKKRCKMLLTSAFVHTHTTNAKLNDAQAVENHKN